MGRRTRLLDTPTRPTPGPVSVKRLGTRALHPALASTVARLSAGDGRRVVVDVESAAPWAGGRYTSAMVYRGPRL